MLHLWTQWNWEPWLLACIGITTVPYLIGMWRMGRDFHRPVDGPDWQEGGSAPKPRATCGSRGRAKSGVAVQPGMHLPATRNL